ncbi:hypothetical protein DL89DRAFT_56695 [Linderina pennispora]|uniref:Secreted protein n=1 Tax=Linderina pennispora TaxID=61395 RepID=A0A1Y1W1E6_9FUNG|nr:uncharacterized protein DL89DRAFT_56695 [Linderina pennispora]ORX67318.1 hypothetical protein DL89DRAFT_56695 [Linderina pennispora]
MTRLRSWPMTSWRRRRSVCVLLTACFRLFQRTSRSICPASQPPEPQPLATRPDLPRYQLSCANDLDWPMPLAPFKAAPVPNPR